MLRWQRGSGNLVILFFSAGSFCAIAGQAVNPSQGQTSSRAVVLDNHSQLSLSDAYRNACSNGGMLVITPGFKSNEPLPSQCENQPAVLDLRRPDSLTGRLNVRNEGALGDGTTDDTAGMTAAIGGSPLQSGQCTSGVARLSGATSSMVASASPVSDPGDGFIWQAFVSAANTVTVKVCAIDRGTPRPAAYNVRVQ